MKMKTQVAIIGGGPAGMLLKDQQVDRLSPLEIVPVSRKSRRAYRAKLQS